jgi:hypothetical protein
MVRLVDGLARAGVVGLAVPSNEALAAAVKPGLVHHHPGDSGDAPPLSASQAALAAELERARL